MTIYSDDEYDPVIVFQMTGNGIGIEGDMNGDATLNILDIVALINYVFNDNEKIQEHYFGIGYPANDNPGQINISVLEHGFTSYFVYNTFQIILIIN